MKSIQKKMTAMVVLIFIVALSALGGINYWRAREIIRENIINNMASQTKDAAGNVGDWLETRKTELSIIALNPAVQSGNAEMIVPFIKNIAKEKKLYSIVGYLYPNGASVNTLGTSVNLGEREYFKQAMRGEAVIGDPSTAKTTGHLNIVVAVPVKVDGKVTGVVYGAIDMEGLTEKVMNIKVGQTGYSYLVQGDGLAIVHPDQEKAMKFNALKDSNGSPLFKAATERMVKGETGLQQYDDQGVKKIMTFAPVAGTNWSLAIEAPMAELTGVVSTLTTLSLITIVIILIITTIVIAWYTRRIAKPIEMLEVAARRVASGDISRTTLGIHSDDEIGRLGTSFEEMTENLRALVQKISGATEQVTVSSEELTASAEQTAKATDQVASAINEVASGAARQMNTIENTATVVDQMSKTIQQIAIDSSMVAGTSNKSAQAAQQGSKAVKNAITQMRNIEETVSRSAKVVAKLGERSKEIDQIVSTISGIAGQTNLLALNAAIEAARAGEQGRGFAVVAEEVRKLAEQSQDAAKQIANLIAEIRQDTDSAVIAMDEGTEEVHIGTEVVNKAGESFEEIYELINGVSTQISGISVAIQQVAAGSQQIVDSVQEIGTISKGTAGQTQTVSAATEEQAATMEEIASSSQALARMAEDLTKAVNGFKV